MSQHRLSDPRSRRSRIFSMLLSSASIAGLAAAALVPIATSSGNAAGAAVITGPATLAQPFSVQFQTGNPTTTDVHLLAFNDFHGNLEPAGLNIYNQYAGGSAFLAKAIKDKQKAFPAQVTVMAGDGIGASPLQSALFNEEPAIVAMNLMNVDFASVGNHEFDKGAAELKRIQAGGCRVPEGCNAAPYALANGTTTNTYPGATFKYLSANVLDTAGNTLFPAFGIKTVPAAGGGTVKIGIIGEVLKETPTIVTPSGVAGLSFVDEAAAANKAAATLKAQGVSTIVLVIHQGGLQSNPNVLSGCTGNLVGSDIERIAKGLDPSISVIVSGHTHAEYRCSISLNGATRLITSASSFGRILTDITLKVNPVDGSLVSADASNSIVANSTNTDRTTPRVDDPSKADPAVAALTAQYVKAAAPLANRVVGKIAGNLTRTANSLGETTLGNVLADAQLASTSSAGTGGAVVAFMNPGGVRADLNVADISSGGEAPGEVTYNEMFTVQPFGNSLVTKTMTGAQLRFLLEQQFIGCGGQTTTRILQISSTLTYEQVPTATTCAGRIDSIKIKGVVVEPSDKFRITMNNFLATGGDGFTVFNGGTDVLGGAQDVDSFADYFKANPNGIEVPALGRITSLASATTTTTTTKAPAVVGSTPAELGFTPITTIAASCTTPKGLIAFANDATGKAVTPSVLMSTGDPATPINAPATSNKVGSENDMIALSPDGQFLYSVSEAGVSEGMTRLTLTGANKGKKEILSAAADSTGKLIWSRMDGVKWYPSGGTSGTGSSGMLLLSEEFANGGVWQVNPTTGAYARLDWMGDYAHEGIGLDANGNMYLGDENRAGAIYKAVPNDVKDLTRGGQLYYLVSNTVSPTGWKLVVDPKKAATEASAGGAVLFDRPEDFEEANGRIYFTVTEPASDSDTRTGAAGQVVNRGGIYSFVTNGVPALSAQSGTLPYNKLTPMIEVNDPKYTSQDQAKAQQGLQFPDNIAFDGAGHLWVQEDIPDGTGAFPANGTDVSKQQRDQQDEMYVYVLNASGDSIVPNPDKTGPGVSGGYKVADMRTSSLANPCENEFSGGIFAADGKTLYINQMHFDNPTLTVTYDRSVPSPSTDSYSVALVGDYNYGCDLDVTTARLTGFVQGTTLPACNGPLADDLPAPTGIQVPGRQKSNLMIADINSANVAFSIHDGDTKSGSTECRESIIDATKAQMNGLPVNGAVNPGYDKPVVYTPGDNEWTDCHRFVGSNKGTIAEQTAAPLKALASIRSKMFSAPVSQGKTTMPLTTQSGYPENARWQRGPVVFATINMPGSNNNYCSPLQTNAICNQNGEAINRNTANLAWVRETFKLAKDQGLKAIVVTAQANPNFERNAANDLPTYDLNGYTDFLNTMRDETKKFDGQVVYVHGDSHTMRFDHPLNDTDGKSLANFTRVETAGQVDAHWIKLSVNPSSGVLLSIEPKIIATNLGNNPNRLPWFVKALPTRLDLAPVAPANGSIGNLIWNDANNNGIKDTSETGIAGVKVTLHDVNTPIQSGVTNASGFFTFTGLPNNDNYQVCISNPSGYLNSNGSGKLDAGQNDPTAADPNNYLDNDDNGRTTALGHCSGYVIVNSAVSTQMANPRVDFGVFADRIVGNLVWNDANNNGLKEAAEAGLSGVKVNLYSAFTFVRSTTTDANGNYAFTGSSNFDNYQVCIENPTGYVNSTGSNKLDAGEADTTGNDPNNYVDDDDNGRTTATGHCSGFIIVSDAVPGNRRVDFGLFVPSTAAAGSFKIGNQIWNDANNNGLRESGEAGVAGVTATLFLNNQSAGKTSVSNSLGVYGFDGLTAGESYQVCLTVPAGMVGSNGSGKLDAGQPDLVAADPNNYVDDDDNGRTWSNGQCSGYIILSDKLVSNQRVDFALFTPTGAVATSTTTTTTASTTTTTAVASTTTTTTTAPGSSGQPPKFNEVESSGGTPGDWAELYNPGTTPADISGWVVRDNDDTHTYTLPAGTVIPAGGYFVVEEAALTFGLGSADSVRLFNANRNVIDSYDWTAHAATTYGRCPNGTGAFALTTTVTKGAANDCSVSTGSSTTSTSTTIAGAPTFAAWPGDSAVQTVDGVSVFGGNLSGLAFEGSGPANSGVIWGARNGPGALFRLVFNGTIWAPDTANGWSTGKLLKYKDGTGNPDAEGVTFTSSGSGGGMYVSTERNNDANSVSRNSILRVDPQSASATLTATHEWNLTADLPTTGPNLGMEAITFVPDSFLVSKGFFDESKNRVYNPGDYPDHGFGLFFVGLEANGQIYAYALNHATEGFTRIASFASGFTGVMDLAFDRELNNLWAVCDDTCLGRSAVLAVSASTGKFVVTNGFERPVGMPNLNNEGFTFGSQAACVNNRKPAYWADDAETGGHALRAGTVSCTAPL